MKIIILFLLVCLSAFQANAQTGNLEGTVTDPQTLPIAQAFASLGGSINMDGLTMTFSTSTETNIAGHYSFPDLPAGLVCTLEISKQGYAPAVITGITITAGATVTQDVVLQPISANDDFNNAKEITGLNYTDNINTCGATLGLGDPIPSCVISPPGTNVWYKYMPLNDMQIKVDTTGSNYMATVGVFKGTQQSSLLEIACSTFNSPFTIAVNAGETYYFMVYGTCGNLTFMVVDATPPEVTIINPPANQALQDGVIFQSQATDASGIDKVFFYLREPDGGEGILIGYEDLVATYNSTTGYWEYFFDTTVLQDGYYVIFAKATDTVGNEGMSSIVPFSIRNWAVITMLPETPNSKAGRTMPVKFSLRIAASVDPAMPFVYNEDLEIRIYDARNPGTILQRSIFGDDSTDYRINGEMYITNFKTGKTPATYVVEIWRPSKNFLVGSFTFKTVK